MRLAGLDIATRTGLTVVRDGAFRASSFKPRAEQTEGLKKGKLDFAYEGRLFHEFRGWLHGQLVENEITDVGIEEPLRSDVPMKKATIDTSAGFFGQAITYGDSSNTNMATVFRLYGLQAHALEICARLSIAVHMFPQQTWRSEFMGVTRAPTSVPKDKRSKWLKDKAREVCALHGIEVVNADQGDSAGIAWVLKNRLYPDQRGLFAR